MNELVNNHYRAFLVRFWRTDEFGRWRVLAKNVQTGEEHHFPTIEACVAFLQAAGSEVQAVPAFPLNHLRRSP
jgi:hypothetical protein